MAASRVPSSLVIVRVFCCKKIVKILGHVADYAQGYNVHAFILTVVLYIVLPRTKYVNKYGKIKESFCLLQCNTSL